jgi:hypothetical protein
MYNNGNSSKNVTGASVVDGTLENADYADNGLSGDKIDGGIISNFQSTGIDDRLPTGKVLTLSDTGIDITGSAVCDGLTITGTNADLALSSSGNNITFYRNADNYVSAAGGSSSNLKLDVQNRLVFTTGGAERMRIDSSGNMTAGTEVTTSNFYFLDPDGSGYNTAPSAKCRTGTASTALRYHYAFGNGNGYIGSISTNGSATAYNTSSDYRLKENVVPMTGSIDRLKALKPSKFNFIADATATVDGFLAHEAQSVVPECVTGAKDAMTDMGNITDAEDVIIEENVIEPTELQEGQTWTKTGDREDYQAIDQSKLVPLLVAALQEAITRIETLENA